MPIFPMFRTTIRGLVASGVIVVGAAFAALVFPVQHGDTNHAAVLRAGFKSKGPKPFDRPQEAARRFLEERLGPGQLELPWEHLRAELVKIRQRQQLADASRVDSDGWTAMAGTDVWRSLGPGNIGGRTRAIVVSPTDPSIMFAAGVAGGVWKSTDGGSSWSSLDDMMLNLAVSSLALDPQNPDVIYAGTGEGFFFSDTFVRGLGIFKSTDGGTTWLQLSGTVNGVPDGSFHYVNKIRISPNDSSRVFAATRTGVWRSLDAGASWSVVLSNPTYLVTGSNSNGSTVGCTDLAIRVDRDPDMLFAAFGSLQADGLFRSFDGGDSWEGYSVPANQGRMTIALAPSDPDIMYLLMADNGSQGSTGQLVNIYRSANGGESFTGQVNFDDPINPWLLSNVVLATGCVTGYTPYSQGWYDNIIAIDPVDPDIVWVGGIGIFRSDDAGENFGLAGYWFLESPYLVHADEHEIVFHPDYDGGSNQIMYVGNDGGLFRTTNARAATSVEDCPFPADQPLPEVVWESLNNGYGVTQFYHGDSAKSADIFIGGSQDNGTSRVQSATSQNSWDMILGGDGGYVFIDPTNSEIVFAEGTFFPDIQKSTDGGDTFMSAVNGISDSDGVFITPFAMDQSNSEVLWTGGRRVWRTMDGAASWQVASADFSGPGLITAYGIAPGNGNVVYLGFNNGYVARSTNALSASPTWEIYGVAQGLQVGANISSVAVSPDDSDTAFCTYSNYGVVHIFKTINGGATWAPSDGVAAAGVPDIPVHWIEIRPGAPDQVFAGTELGVFRSLDGGSNWDVFNAWFPNTVVESLDFKDADTLVAFTHGRGAFEVDLGSVQGGDVPTTSTWGVVVLALGVMASASLVFSRRYGTVVLEPRNPASM